MVVNVGIKIFLFGELSLVAYLIILAYLRMTSSTSFEELLWTTDATSSNVLFSSQTPFHSKTTSPMHAQGFYADIVKLNDLNCSRHRHRHRHKIRMENLSILPT